jgi:hypothetical protein
MSRSGYIEDYDDNWQLIRWRGAVKSAVRGKRGQAFFRDLIAALDAMPVKELHAHELRTADGAVCALGALASFRGVDVSAVDPHDTETVASTFGLSDALVRETVYMNDEAGWYNDRPAARWTRMRQWAADNLRDTDA